MKHFTYESYNHVYEDCYFSVNYYADKNKNTAISLISESEGPMMTITTNIKDKLPGDQIAIKNWSENDGVEDWLYNLGIIEANPVDYYLASLYVEVPIYKLTAYGREILDIA